MLPAKLRVYGMGLQSHALFVAHSPVHCYRQYVYCCVHCHAYWRVMPGRLVQISAACKIAGAWRGAEENTDVMHPTTGLETGRDHIPEREPRESKREGERTRART